MPEPELTLDTIFCRAIELRSPDDRAAYIAGACVGKDDLRHQVESLVAAHFLAGPFLSPPRPASDSTVAGQAPETAGTVIGSYKLLEQIGEGGMGVVYVAEQTSPMKRRVALKVIKPGMDTKEVIARFEAERQALALMDHPNIARVFDGGVHDGRPYFVMELVRGLPITDYCDRAGLSTRDRLALFATVCRAVQHAHQKGVIHRDLKPSNILVTLHDGTPVPKVIDFGVAKAVSQPLTEKSVYTRFAQMVGTPLYMSPEQAELSGLDVDTRSDVYSLGVLLYQLLTGTTPFDGETLRKAGLDEMRRMIREDEPPRPSTRVSTLGAEKRSDVSGGRGLDERRLSRLLRGDLDWVAMRALEKDRNRRYDSAGAFAADVERYLADEPVEARPPTAWYRLRKSARRNRGLLITVGLVAAALLAGTGVSIWQAIRATTAQRQAEVDRDRAEIDRDRAEKAEKRATTEADIAREVNHFLQKDMIGQVGGELPNGTDKSADPHMTVKAALDRAAARIGERFQEQPLIEAAIRMAIGAAYCSLAEHNVAVSHFERALQIRKVRLGPDHSATLSSVDHLAEAYRWAGRRKEAIALYQQLLENRKATLGPDHAETLSCLRKLAIAYRFDGQWDKSLPLFTRLLEKLRSNSGLTQPETIDSMHHLAMNYMHMSRFEDSIALHEQLMEAMKSTGSQNIWYMRTYAQACIWTGKSEHAERLRREIMQLEQLRRDSQGLRRAKANTLGWLAQSLLLQQKFPEAEQHAREAVAILEKLASDSPRRFYWTSLLGAVLAGQKKYPEAELFLLRGYEGQKQREAVAPKNEERQLTVSGEWVIHYYQVTGQPEKVREWQAKLAPLPRQK